MTETKSGRAHLIAGGFPPGSSAGHDHDYARLRLLGLLAEQDVPASVANDFADVEKWLPVSQLLITYVAGPYPDAAQCRAIQRWLEAGGRWLGLHGTSGGRAERVEGVRQRRTVKLEHHALLGSYFLTHPPICKIRVDVAAGDARLTRGLGASFDVEDGPHRRSPRRIGGGESTAAGVVDDQGGAGGVDAVGRGSGIHDLDSNPDAPPRSLTRHRHGPKMSRAPESVGER